MSWKLTGFPCEAKFIVMNAPDCIVIELLAAIAVSEVHMFPLAVKPGMITMLPSGFRIDALTALHPEPMLDEFIILR